MLKKDITFANPFDGEESTETHYFNLSKSELIDIEISYKEGFTEHFKKIIAEENRGELLTVFKLLLKTSYGVRSEDGKRFIKNDQVWEEFRTSGAFDAFYTELITNTDAQVAFMNGIMPADLIESVEKMAANASADLPAEAKALTRAEAVEMDADELSSGLATGRYRLVDDIAL